MFQSDPFALIVLFVGMSLLPFGAMIATSYLNIVILMSLIRNALGIQSIPPNMVINALAMILTFYVMAPVFSESWDIASAEMAARKPPAAVAGSQAGAPNPANPAGVGPYAPDLAVVSAASEPFRTWLSNHTPDKQRSFFVRTAEQLWGKDGEPAEIDRESFYILLPSFCVGELTKAFQIGFLVYLPFIAIDIIVSNILLAMGMMMVSPVTISLPFKLLLFVMVDGWTLLVQGLIRGYVL